MANVAFNKHISFCEKYMKELQETFYNLFAKGDTEEAVKYANNLFRIREEYTLWLNDEINEKLEAYEKLIRKLGANAHFIKVTRDSSSHVEQRSLFIDNNFELFAQLMGMNSNENEIDYDRAIAGAKIKVREILAIDEITKLRKELVANAVNKNT